MVVTFTKPEAAVRLFKIEDGIEIRTIRGEGGRSSGRIRPLEEFPALQPSALRAEFEFFLS